MRVLRAALAALLFAGLTGTAAAAPAETTFAGTVGYSGCSAATVRFAGAADTDNALVLTNGHCVRLLGADEVVVNEPWDNFWFWLYDDKGNGIINVQPKQVLYATMSGTDIALIQLHKTYADVAAYGAKTLELASSPPAAGTAIDLPSSFAHEIFRCEIDGFVPQLKEDRWTWRDSIRYTTCATRNGTSGTPILNRATGKVIGINNTGNDSGERCTLGNPCEVDDKGTVTVRKGQNYGQQTYPLYTCLGAHSTIDLTKSGCTLPKPK
ncbi:serine protease [Pseudonocardiaceae bacterium YIM PH 21723]|nr:serine protease [Pseudonocardiaceae bacterium YIM PH 21723]